MMHRSLPVALLLLALPLLARAADEKDAGWGTVKGQVIFNGNAPAAKVLAVQPPAPACVAKNPPLDEVLVVNPKNKGVRWAVVSLGPLEKGKKLPIHKDLQAVPKEAVEIDQPCCAFVPHIVAMRQGQDIAIKNSAAFLHNANCVGSRKYDNDGFNIAIQPGGKHVPEKKLNAQPLPINLKCTVHPFMQAYIAVFDHPYFAITDADGNFTIPKAPAGKYRIKVWQEKDGWRGGAEGAVGEIIEIKKDGITEAKLDLK